MDDDIPYLLLTPGPLTTSRTVKQVMLSDFCTWDDDYNSIVEDIRHRLTRLASDRDDYTCALMQGSGTFAVEATLGTVVPPEGKVVVVNNGAYGARLVAICRRLNIECIDLAQAEDQPADLLRLESVLADTPNVTHIVVVHCETTTGLLNPVQEIGELAHRFGQSYIVDAMSSFGGIPMTMEQLHADYLISSANKCIQGVPGFAFVIAKRASLETCSDQARSLSLDLYDQWREMEEKGGKWRYTSPTHTVRAFSQALDELAEEGGIEKRYDRYVENQQILVEGLQRIGFQTLVERRFHSPIITSFLYPPDDRFRFEDLYHQLKARRFVIYPGKVSHAPTFRVGTIGHVFPDDIRQLVRAFLEVVEAAQWQMTNS